MTSLRRVGIAAGSLSVLVVLAGCASAPADSSARTIEAPIVAASTSATMTLEISGGYETDPVDRGRPVVLIAAALGVPTEVFREAFSGVNPAGAGQEVDEERAQANKAALLAVLGPYGITNERLDEVSNFYRYVESAGEIWSHRDATVTAALENGIATAITIVDPGYGYSSTPTVTLPTGQQVDVELTYGTDLGTNGGISSITLR